MKKMPTEFIFQLFALLIAVILVHSVYLTVIRPNADAVILEQRAQIETNPDYIAERSFYVIVRDFEQEACFVLMLWAFSMLGYKGWVASREHKLLLQEFIPITDGMRILPEDCREYARPIQNLPAQERQMLLPRVLLSALGRFGATRNVQDVSSSVHTLIVTEAERLESELSMIRYIAWAIPSIGFIGTVRGIGSALAQAHRAVEGDISGVTENLGVAFNSTFIALLISIVLMFIIHQLQLMQERLAFETENYVDEHLIRHIQSD
ncbi:MAG: MotA/TolQ/ExbB proton channel family protein [Gammaproteobacteria bacterium]|nr:MotA/TolQ/ExbB proton channel family protein [Gammaproteobacteria bacterium]MCP4090058.1 MotA/TolQ/ExbB proton channel family protein [Gammaproteobacteria bacterium]MCP4277052.1 MotA/TolQ/ExbB proton channel family protein [Gammaproteobacteria bacterium]MCP4832725.1 MotA/TolQ/ExbB proton channel family protein [Gammaproteobacteria bacterium]MCP4929918.1 MotA/TolQ/ExbB proton channel family protein [Gammaproteobacteria bacterium]